MYGTFRFYCLKPMIFLASLNIGKSDENRRGIEIEILMFLNQLEEKSLNGMCRIGRIFPITIVLLYVVEK